MPPATLTVKRLGWPVSNVWLLPGTEIGPVLIDCGFPALWPAILLTLRVHGLGNDHHAFH